MKVFCDHYEIQQNPAHFLQIPGLEETLILFIIAMLTFTSRDAALSSLSQYVQEFADMIRLPCWQQRVLGVVAKESFLQAFDAELSALINPKHTRARVRIVRISVHTQVLLETRGIATFAKVIVSLNTAKASHCRYQSSLSLSLSLARLTCSSPFHPRSQELSYREGDRPRPRHSRGCSRGNSKSIGACSR